MAEHPYQATAASCHRTTTAGDTDIITLDRGYGQVEILNRDAAADLWVTIGTGAADPVADADGTYYVGPGASRVLDLTTNYGAAAAKVVVKLMSASAINYSVTGLGPA